MAVVPHLAGSVTSPPYLTISLSKSKLFCSAAVYANWPTSPEVIVAPLSERSLNTDL
jgi:hypothetical protein